MSDIIKKFESLIDGKKEEDEAANKPENIADYPDEINEIIDSSESSDQSIDPVEEVSNIENDAKEYFNANHEDSIEDRIKSLRENALNTYAKDDVSEDESSVDDSDTQIYDENDESADAADDSADDDTSDSEKSEENDGSQNYSMTQLLKILKTEEYSEEDDDTSSVKKKKKKGLEFTDETDIADKLANQENETNLYHYSFEYEGSHQNAEMHKSFRNSAFVSCISFVLTLIFTALCIWIECGHGAGLPFSHVLKPGYFGKVYAMVSLQMLAFCVMFNLDGFARGIRKLSIKKSAPESVAVISVSVCALHTLLSGFFASANPEYQTFCFAGCIISLFLSFNTFVKAYTRFKSFVMAASSKPKFTTVKLDALSEENSTFAKYLGEDSDVLCVSRANCVADFIKNSYTVPQAVSGCNFIVYLTLILGVVTAVARCLLFDSGIYKAVTDGISVIMFSAPVTFLLASSLPYFITSARISKLHNSVIGEAACDSFENTGVISFDDTEVFPPKAVKVTSIKTYNEKRIDSVIMYMAKIFDKLGGPLSHVFSSSIQGGAGDINGVRVLESSKDGVHLTVDGDDVLVGNSNYLRLFDIDAPIDENDEAETRALTSILYLVAGGELAAKFYIRYTLNRKFEEVLNGLYDAGVCCGVRTNDPGVDNRIIEANLRESNYPISVIHKPLKDIGKTEQTSSGALIGLSGIHSYLRSFIMLDRLRGTYKTNSVFAILGSIIGLAVSIVFVFSGIGITSLTTILFYLFWMIPQLLISFFRK